MDSILALDLTESTVASPGIPAPLPKSGIYDWWVRLPERAVRPAPDAQRYAVEIRRFTGWSARTIADVVGSTHPTIGGLLEGRIGRTNQRTESLRSRLAAAHEVVSRVFVLTGRDPDRTGAALMVAGEGDGGSAANLLSRGEVARAYLAATDRLRQRERSGLLTGRRTVMAGEATASLHDED